MKKNIFSAIIIYILLCLSNNSFAVNLKTSLEKLKELYREKKYTQAVKFIEADYEIQNVLENTEYINGIPESYCYLIACSYYQAKEYEKAINYYSKVTQKESILSDYALFHMSECYKYKKKYSSAIYYYELLTEKYPRSSNLYEAYYNKAECYEKIGKYIESIDELNKIIKMSPQWNPARVLLKKGRIFELMHKWTDAETIYQKIVSIYPKSSDTQEALMRICYIEKKYPAYKIEKKAEEIWDRGMAYFYSHEYRNAVNQFKEIIDNKLDKELEDNCYNMIGKAYYKRYNFWKAIDFFKVATEKYHQGETYIDSLFELANSYVIVKNGDSALFIYNKIDTEYSYSGYGDNALYRVAKYYESRKKYDESIKNYLQLIKKYPQSIYKDISYWNIACICIQQNHMEDAINYFKTLYHDLPQSKYAVEAYFWAGKCFEKSGNWIEAAEIYRKILIENYNKTYFYYRAQERLNWINSNKYECLSLKEEKDFFDTAKEYYNKKNYTMAIENFRKVINLYGNSKRALSSINIVKKCFKEQKIWPEIFNNDEIVTREKLLDSFISKYVYAKGYSNRLDYLNSIKELLNLGLYDEALTEIDKLRRIDYKDIDLLYIRILSSKENEQYHKAIESTEILIRLITDQDSRAYLKDESFLPKPLKEFSYPNYYSEYVEKYAQEYNVDPLFVYAIIKEESRFKLEARSYANAIGLMQIIPSTGRFIAQNMGQKKFSVEKLYEPETNIKMGIWYISYLLDKFEGNKFHTLAAYNGGPANVKRWLKRCSDKNDTDEFISIVSLDETHSYVKKVLASFNNYKDIYTLTNP